MSRAWLHIKKHLTDRQAAFVSGFQAVGFKVLEGDPPIGAAGPGDVYAIWNRRGAEELVADRVERAGGTVIVAENGYLGRDGDGHQYLAVARHGHNGSGQPLIPPVPGRWERLGAEIRPWRESGSHIVVAPNRFIAPSWFKMPADWVQRTTAEIRRHTPRPILERPHPGHWKRLPAHPSIELRERYLRGAWACVVWSSTAAVHALLEGIPVVATAPFGIVRSACETDLSAIEYPRKGNRGAAFDLLARSQFTLAEIASGLPFASLRTPAEVAA